MASNFLFDTSVNNSILSNTNNYYGLLDITNTNLNYIDSKNLIYECFELNTIFLYPGLNENQIFFIIDQKELNDLKTKLIELSPTIQLKEINQTLKKYNIYLDQEKISLFLRRIDHIAGAKIDDNNKNHLLCCDYQKQLITKFIQTKWFNESNLTEISSSKSLKDGLPLTKNDYDYYLTSTGDTTQRTNHSNINSSQITTSTASQRLNQLISDDDDDVSDDTTSSYDKYVLKKTLEASNKQPASTLSTLKPIEVTNIRSSGEQKQIFQFNFRFSGLIELELLNIDLLEIHNVEAIVNFAKYNLMPSISLQTDLTGRLNELCGPNYAAELEEFKRVKLSYDSGTVLHTTSGYLKHYKHIIHAVIPIGWSTFSDEERYNEMFFIYLNVFNYAEQNLGLKSIALQMIDANSYVEQVKINKINALAFIEALKSYLELAFNNGGSGLLKKIFITPAGSRINVVDNCLFELKNYLSIKNYLNLNLLDELDEYRKSLLISSRYSNDANTTSRLSASPSTSRQSSVTTSSRLNDDSKRNTYKVEIKVDSSSFKPIVDVNNNMVSNKKCLNCKKEVNLKLILNENDRTKCKLSKCEICNILLKIIEISRILYRKYNNIASSLTISHLCINCSIELLVNSLEMNNVCACCYGNYSNKTNNLNKVCNLHSICEKCIKKLYLSGLQCKFCLLNKLNIYLDKINKVNLFDNHDLINCSYDFCDLKSSSSAFTPVLSNEIPTIELTCGHVSCFSIRNRILESNHNQATASTSSTGVANTAACTFCIFKKLFEILTNNKNTGETVSLIVERNDFNQQYDDNDENYDVHKFNNTAVTKPITLTDERSFKPIKDKIFLDDDSIEELNKIQPSDGTMDVSIIDESLPGFEGYKTIVIDYKFPSGEYQDMNSAMPKAYLPVQKRAYLPNNAEGIKLCELLRQAFNAGCVFKIEYSDNYDIYYITWNGITHKTKKTGGFIDDGYPDDMYLNTLKKELATKGFS